MLTQVQIISPTPTGKTERSLGRAAVTTHSVGGRKGVVAVLPSPPSPPPFSSAHTINNLKFNTNLQLLQILPSEGYVCTKHFLQFWEVTTSSRQIKYTTSIFNICVLCSLTPWCWHFTLLKRQIEKYASTNFGSDGNKSVSLSEKNFNHSAFNGTVGYQTDQTPPIT